MLEASLADTINMTGLDTSLHHPADEFIKIILWLSLVPGLRAKITNGTLHKLWIMIWCSFLDITQCGSEIDREADMVVTEVNISYDEYRWLKKDPPPPEETYHRSMVVLTCYNVLTLRVWAEQCNNYKLMWKLSQVMRGHALHSEIYDDENIRGITWLIICYGCQYFSQSLMQSEFTVNSMEGEIALPTPSLHLLVQQLSIFMPIRVRVVPEKCRDRYIVYWTHENKQGGEKGHGQGRHSWRNSKR